MAYVKSGAVRRLKEICARDIDGIYRRIWYHTARRSVEDELLVKVSFLCMEDEKSRITGDVYALRQDREIFCTRLASRGGGFARGYAYVSESSFLVRFHVVVGAPLDSFSGDVIELEGIIPNRDTFFRVKPFDLPRIQYAYLEMSVSQ